MGVTTRLLRRFLVGFAGEISALRKAGLFDDAWLLDGKHNEGGWLPGRLWGAMARAVPRPWVPNLEARLWTTGCGMDDSYKPDLVITGPNDRLALAVELESTNSSDDRVVFRDIERLFYLAKQKPVDRPRGVLLVTMLPRSPVTNLPMYGVGRRSSGHGVRRIRTRSMPTNICRRWTSCSRLRRRSP